MNAATLASAGAATVVKQADFTPPGSPGADAAPGRSGPARESRRGCPRPGHADAADRLADLVVKTAGRG